MASGRTFPVRSPYDNCAIIATKRGKGAISRKLTGSKRVANVRPSCYCQGMWCQQWSLLIFLFNRGQGGISSSVLSVLFTDNCYKLLKSVPLIGWEQICQWKTLTKCLMKCPPGVPQVEVRHFVWMYKVLWAFSQFVKFSGETWRL